MLDLRTQEIEYAERNRRVSKTGGPRWDSCQRARPPSRTSSVAIRPTHCLAGFRETACPSEFWPSTPSCVCVRVANCFPRALSDPTVASRQNVGAPSPTSLDLYRDDRDGDASCHLCVSHLLSRPMKQAAPGRPEGFCASPPLILTVGSSIPFHCHPRM
jgi:hypothetical protein